MQQEIKWPAEGNARVPYRMFSDPDVYQAELSRIFLGPTWQYLALAGELPQPGDYLTTFVGETPVIVTRGHDGEIHAMVNRCAHRGNLVCLKRRGHADNLTCVYHAWRYDLEGNLDTSPFGAALPARAGCRRASSSKSTASRNCASTGSVTWSSARSHKRRRPWRITSAI